MKINSKMYISIVGVILTLMPLSYVNAGTIDSFEIQANVTTLGIFNSVDFLLDFGGDQILEQTTGGIVFDLDLSNGSFGQKYSVSSGNEFNEAITFLTNGFNDPAYWRVMGAGPSASEAYFFYGDGSGAKGIDFYGYDIDSINLMVNSLFISNDGFYTNVAFDGTVTIEGSPVPLPGAIWFFASGLASLFGFSLKKFS